MQEYNIGPYKWQRKRHRLGEYPRPSQPNTSQPNQIMRPVGNSTKEYWVNVYEDYLKRVKTGSSLTNLSLGRLR